MKRSVPITNMLRKRQTSYEYDKNLKKNHRNFSEHQRFRQIFIRCQRWLKRQGVTAPLETRSVSSVVVRKTSNTSTYVNMRCRYVTHRFKARYS